MIQTNEQSVAPSPWRLPERLVSRGTKLLTQQCWNWGCDVRRPEGNLLLEAGFTRVRPPAEITGSTLYALQPTPETQIILWSFGIFYGQAALGGLVLDRFRFAPQRSPTPTLPLTIWTQEQLPPLRRPGAADREALALLLGGLLDWIGAYESAVLAAHGLAYRESCLAQWSRRKLGVPAAELPTHWEAFGADCAGTLAERAAA
ncbi:MAG: hypothetical protein HC828_07890 [Blastochloris sp.]|nr:hypothetical protein [Blastochloris sp.]